MDDFYRFITATNGQTGKYENVQKEIVQRQINLNFSNLKLSSDNANHVSASNDTDIQVSETQNASIMHLNSPLMT